MSTSNELHVETTGGVGGEPVVSVSGEIDMASAKELLRDVTAVISRSAPGTTVLINLSEVSFIDSSGISALLLARRDALAARMSLRVDAVSPAVLRTLQIAGVAAILGIGARKPAPEPPPARPAPIPDAMSVLSSYLVGDSTLGETLHRVVEITRSALPQAAYVGITMMMDGRLGTHVQTDPKLVDIDRPQYETGRGPCVEALTTSRTVIIGSISADETHPEFARSARQAGIRSIVSLPMKTNARTVGALNLYARNDHAFSVGDVQLAETFATQGAALMVNAQAYWDARTLSENLSQAMASRDEVEQAKGIIMATEGVSADAAFAELVRRAQRDNLKVRDIAVEIVNSAERGAHGSAVHNQH